MIIDNELLKKRIINNDNLIIKWPKKTQDQNIILKYISERFLLGKAYTEKEVNRIIKESISFDDFALIRRELFDRGYIDRTADCKEYRRIEKGS